MAHIRQTRPQSGLGFQEKVVKTFNLGIKAGTHAWGARKGVHQGEQLRKISASLRRLPHPHDLSTAGASVNHGTMRQPEGPKTPEWPSVCTTQGPSWGYLKVNLIFGDKRPRNGSKNGEMAPRTGTGCPHIGPFVEKTTGCTGRCRASLANLRQSRPASGRGFQTKVVRGKASGAAPKNICAPAPPAIPFVTHVSGFLKYSNSAYWFHES